MCDDQPRIGKQLLIVAIVALVALGGMAIVTANDGVSTSLSPEETDVEAGEQVTLEIVAEDVPDDVGAYAAQITVSDPSIAEIVEFEPTGTPEYGGGLGTITDNGSKAKIDAAYGDDSLETPDKEVVLATVTVETSAKGDVTVSHTVDAIGDGDGTPLEIAHDGDSDDVVLNVQEDGDGDPGDPEPSEEFVISHIETDAPVTEGDTLVLDTIVENTNPTPGEQTVELVSETGTTLDEASLELEGETSEGITFQWDTSAADVGTHILEIRTDNDSMDTTVEVLKSDDKPPELTIEHNPGSATAKDPVDGDGAYAYADQLDIFVETDDPIVFGGDADRAIRVVDVESGQSVTYEPTGGEKAVPLDDIYRLGIQNEGTGDPEEIIRLFPESDSDLEYANIDASVEGDTGIFTDGPFGSYVIELLDEDGSVIDATDERLVGMGYEATYDQDGEVATINRDGAVDEDWYVEFWVTGDDPTLPLNEEILDRVVVDHDDSDDAFEIPLDDLDVDEGEYDWSLILREDKDVEPDRERIVRINGGPATDNGVVISDGPEIHNIEVDTTLTNDEVTISADIEAANADVESVNLGVTADFMSFTVTESADEVKTTGTVYATIDSDDVVAEGEYTAIVEATDEFGNTVTETGNSVEFDTSPPEIQLRADDLAEDDAMLILEGDEPFDLTDLEIEADGDGIEDRTPPDDEIPDRLGSADDDLIVTFDGGTQGGDDTTFTITVEGEDDAGNDATAELESAIAGYEIEDGNAHVESDDVATSFNLSGNEGKIGDETTRKAVVTESDTLPAGTELDDDLLAGSFLDVDDIGLGENELEEATIRVPVDALDDEITDAFDAAELEILRSADGDSKYETVDTEFNEEANELTADIEGFSQFAAAGTDDKPPVVDSVTVNPGTDLDPEDGPVTVDFEYSPAISDIDVAKTEINVDVGDERVEEQIDTDSASVQISDLKEEESITVELTLVDEAGNQMSESKSVAVNKDDAGTGTGGNGSTGSGGGGGGSGGPASTTIPAPPQNVEVLVRGDATIQPGETGEYSVAEPGDFLNRPIIASAFFHDPDLTAEMTVRDFDEPPAETGSPPGDVYSVSEIIIPTSIEQEEVTLRFDLGRIETPGVDSAEVEPDELTVWTYADGEWIALETTTVSGSNSESVLEASTDVYSYYVITNQDDVDDSPVGTDDIQEDDSEAISEDDGIPGFGFSTALLTFLVVLLIILTDILPRLIFPKSRRYDGRHREPWMPRL